MIGKKTIWTPEMIKYLTKYHSAHQNKQLASNLGLTLTVVRNNIYELQLARYNQKERYWTDEEDAILISLYKTTGDVAIGKKLNRPKGGVRKRRITLGLIRTVEEINKIVQGNMNVLKKTQFKPGNISKNNPVKAWNTRRQRDAMPAEQIVKRIQHREKANFYR